MGEGNNIDDLLKIDRENANDQFETHIVEALGGFEPDNYRQKNKTPPCTVFYNIEEIVKALQHFTQIGDVLIMGNSRTMVYGLSRVRQYQDRIWLFGDKRFDSQPDGDGYLVKPEFLSITPNRSRCTSFVSINSKKVHSSLKKPEPAVPSFVTDGERAYDLFDLTRCREPLLIFPFGSAYVHAPHRARLVHSLKQFS
jgi:hypothetical protein